MDIKFGDKNKKEKDLFDQFQAGGKKTAKKAVFFIPKIKKDINLSYENIIFLIIGFVMFCLISFSLGVEKGRQDAKNIACRVEIKEPVTDIVIPARGDDRRIDVDDKEIAAGKKEFNFALQLAAFKQKEAADRECLSLKNEGHKALVKETSGYYQVYIAAVDRQNADELLKRLKKQYKDAYIKKL